MGNRTGRHVTTSALLAAALLGPVTGARAGDPAGTPTRLLLGPGSAVPGSPVGDVAFSPLRVVHGGAGWVMDITMDGYVEMVVAEHGLGVHEGQVLPGGEVVDEIWLWLDGDASGRLASSVFLADGRQAVVLDEAVVLAEGDLLTAAGIEPGSAWVSLYGVDLDGADHLTVLGRLEEPSTPGTLIDALVRFDIVAAGVLAAPAVLMSVHELVDGRAIDHVGNSSDLTFARNDAGQLIHTVRFAGAAEGEPGPSAIVLDGVVLAESGTPSLVPGRDWVVSYGDLVALNAQGDWAFRTRIDAGLLGDSEVLVYNGQIVMIEGAAVPGLPDTAITRLHAPRLAENGALLWLVEWDDGSSLGGEGFFVDGELVVASGATQIEGKMLLGTHNDSLKYDIAADGSRLVFVGYPQTGGWGSYEAPTGPWQDLGGGLAGTGGLAPTLFGLGSLQPGSPVSVELAGALPGATTNLVIGFSQLGAPFLGGVLCPAPDVLVLGLPVDGDGSLALSGTFPGGVPSSTSLHLQAWTADPGGPAGHSATNCLVGTAP